MAKSKGRTRLVCALLALAVCAGVLGMAPLRARAEGTVTTYFGCGGGGGGAGEEGFSGGAGGLNGLSEEGTSPAGVAGGNGAQGGSKIDGTTTYNGERGIGGQVGMPGGRGDSLRFAMSNYSGDIVHVRGGNAGESGQADTGTPGTGGPGGDVGLNLYDSTANSLLVQGGQAGDSGAGNLGGNAGVYSEDGLRVGRLEVLGGLGSNSGLATLNVTHGLAADSITVNAGDSAGPCAVNVLGDLTISSAITVSGGSAPGVMAMLGDVIVPDTCAVTVTQGANGLVDFPRGGAGSGSIILGNGASLNLVNNSTQPFAVGCDIELGVGATLTVDGVTITGAVLGVAVTGPDTYDLASTDPLALTLSTNLDGVVMVQAGSRALVEGADYTVNGLTVSLLPDGMRQLSTGPLNIAITMGNNQVLTHNVTVTDTRPPSFTMNFTGIAGFEMSLDGGATWQPMQNGVAADTSPAKAAGRFLVRPAGGWPPLDSLMVIHPRTLNHGNWAQDSGVMEFTTMDGGPLQGPDSMTMTAVPIPHLFGALTPDYGGGDSFTGGGDVVMRSGVEPVEEALGILSVVLDGTIDLTEGVDWTNATASPYAVRLSNSLLAKLANGTHTVHLVLYLPTSANPGGELGYATGSFTVALPAPAPTPAPAQPAQALAASPQTGDIGTGPYVVFAVSGGLMIVWLGMQVFKRRKK